MSSSTETTILVNDSSTSYSSTPVNWSLYYSTEVFTIVFLSILGLASSIFNGFTLYAIYKDPMRCFRTPLTTFITGIIISDFLTGLFVEPAIAAISAVRYFHGIGDVSRYNSFLRITQILALVTMNTSFLSFLALAVSQLMALAWPRTYERRVTNTTAKNGIGVIWFYSVLFSLLPEITHMSFKVFFVLDLVLNTTIVTVSLIVIYIATYVVFKTKIHDMVDNQPEQPRAERPPQLIERDFLKGTFLLTLVLLITVWPYTISLYIWFFKPATTLAHVIDKYVAVVICEDILFLKFLWDPAILILRFPTYRKSMVLVCSGLVSNNAAGVVVYNRYADEETRDDFQETIVEEDVRHDPKA